MHLLVLGGTGLVGSHLIEEAIDRGHEVSWTYFSTERQDPRSYQLDKTNAEAVETLVSDIEPDAVVDAAAFVDVDACETEQDRAWSVNAAGTRHVSTAAAANDAHYVSFSTDYVFPGVPDAAPYSVEDAVNPPNYYGMTKYAGEGAARIADNWTTLRTSVVYGSGSQNFVTWALSELEAENEVNIVNDQVSTPTYVVDLARAAIRVLEQEIMGLHHAAGPISLSRYTFTKRLAEGFDLDPSLVNPISTEELGQVAQRPADGSLDSSNFYDLLGWKFHEPTEAFRTMGEQTKIVETK